MTDTQMRCLLIVLKKAEIAWPSTTKKLKYEVRVTYPEMWDARVFRFAMAHANRDLLMNKFGKLKKTMDENPKWIALSEVQIDESSGGDAFVTSLKMRWAEEFV